LTWSISRDIVMYKYEIFLHIYSKGKCERGGVMKGVLYLEDSTIYEGKGFGKTGTAIGLLIHRPGAMTWILRALR
jgi:hypothetical protein